MQLWGRNLLVQIQGEDVKLLHKELRLLGFDIPEDEVVRTFVERATAEALHTRPYNVVMPHKSLRQGRTSRTPAMAMGMTAHGWS